MNPKLDALFDEPEKRYLNADELSVLSQYVSSIPERMKAYRLIRDQEIALMQPVADTLQQQMPNASEALLERSVRNGLLILRYAAMAMLVDDEAFMDQRLQGWLPEMAKAYNTQAIDQKLLEIMISRLSQALPPQQMSLLKPSLAKAQAILKNSRETVESISSPLSGVL
ncbi:MAG TPA: hypothetical protein V6D07_14585 [Trichocoleus sp.]